MAAAAVVVAAWALLEDPVAWPAFAAAAALSLLPTLVDDVRGRVVAALLAAIAAALAFVAGVLCLVLIRQKDFVVRGGPRPPAE